MKKILTIGLGVVLAATSIFIFSVAAQAQNVSASTPANPVIIAAPACPVFNRSLHVGLTGNDVTALQAYLNAHGYLTVSPTGYFGPLTESAVGRWQAQGGVVALNGFGSGTFGPLSRLYFSRSCSTTSSGSASTTQSVNFSANPSSGIAPLTVQFIVSAPQGSTIGNSVNFGDGTSGTLGFVPVCSSCNLMATVSHTYNSTGTYTASLMSGACPANGICNCPNMMILATTTVVVTNTNTSTASSTIQQLNAPGNVSLTPGGIAEVRNASFYFTLTSVTASNATITITPVGCWNAFPSDPAPKVICMIAIVPIQPQTLSIGQKYQSDNYGITLTRISNGTATFSVE